MQSDTETESEPESPPGSNGELEPTTVLQQDELLCDLEDALAAVERIKKTDLSVVQQVSGESMWGRGMNGFNFEQGHQPSRRHS